METIGIIGTGFMGSSLAGAIRTKYPHSKIGIIEKDSHKRDAAMRNFTAIDYTNDVAGLLGGAQAVILAIKPQDLDTLAAQLPDGTVVGGMMNIGRRPTFDGMNVTVEVHLFDFEGDLYGDALTVQFLRRLRDEQKFDSPDALAVQLSEDEQHCRSIVKAFD